MDEVMSQLEQSQLSEIEEVRSAMIQEYSGEYITRE